MFHRSVTQCEVLVKELYSNIGLEYRESSSEDEGVGGGNASEVIEIDDDEDDDDDDDEDDEDDDDVIAVGCGKWIRVSGVRGSTCLRSAMECISWPSYLRSFIIGAV